MTYQFPRCRFADTNTLAQQSRKILQEAQEVFAETLRQDGTDEEWVMEILDVLHAAETGLWIVERERGPGFVEDMKARVIRKNEVRGLYEVL